MIDRVKELQKGVRRGKGGALAILGAAALSFACAGPVTLKQTYLGCIVEKGPAKSAENHSRPGQKVVVNVVNRRITLIAWEELGLEVKQRYDVHDRVKITLTANANPGSSGEDARRDMEARVAILEKTNIFTLDDPENAAIGEIASVKIEKDKEQGCAPARAPVNR